MPEPIEISRNSWPDALPCPDLSLDGKPFPGGTVVVVLGADRSGHPITSALVWHAKVDATGRWSHPLTLHRTQIAALEGHRSVYLLVSWAGRRIGEYRLKIGR
jgi:hypothetical protein